ncbi:pectin lyase F [Penicillium daleae]|uniref:Pectin lyase F n=1 Tax=Penicillium daleae TaxID=63821 RepID=A0AAD6G037_9EURO|nr:pectin lyase F [Penicillium daleae]KAJ5440200.1 pectin lyase F [Penicillium daleae]
MAPSRTLLTAVALLGAIAQAAGVSGTAVGFAIGTTGGGNARSAAPSDISQLTGWLTKKLHGSQDNCTDCKCCIPSSNSCGSSVQNAIDLDSSSWCGSYPTTTCTYDKAAIDGMHFASNKSIVGVCSTGVIRGKGLRLVNGVSKVIIQNVHITELNPWYI